MKVRILGKIYHHTNIPNWSTPFRRKREEHLIRQLGIAAPYGCNLTSLVCQSVNVLNLFDRTSRRHRSHGSRKYNKHDKPEIHNVSFDGLLPFGKLKLGLHHIRTRLYSLPLNMLHDLFESTLTLHFSDASSLEHRLQGSLYLNLDISSNRLFFLKLPGYVISRRQKNRQLLKIKFANKGIDVLNLRNIMNQKSVQSNITKTFKTRSRHAFPIAILAQLLPKILITKGVCSKSTSIVFPRIHYLVHALAQSLYAPCGHILKEISVSCKMKKIEIFKRRSEIQGTCLIFMTPEL